MYTYDLVSYANTDYDYPISELPVCILLII